MIENAEDLDIVMPMFNLVEYSHNYFMTSGSLWNYSKDETNDVDDVDDVDYSDSDGKSFKYKTKIVEETPEKLLQPGNPRDTDQSAQLPVQSLNIKFFIPVKNPSIGDFLICL